MSSDDRVLRARQRLTEYAAERIREDDEKRRRKDANPGASKDANEGQDEHEEAKIVQDPASSAGSASDLHVKTDNSGGKIIKGRYAKGKS